jgi:hypothetical protein
MPLVIGPRNHFDETLPARWPHDTSILKPVEFIRPFACELIEASMLMRNLHDGRQETLSRTLTRHQHLLGTLTLGAGSLLEEVFRLQRRELLGNRHIDELIGNTQG